MKHVVDVADAVAAALNAAPPDTFGPAFTAQRRYRPYHELADLETLRVIVVPRGFTFERHDRSSNLIQAEVDIGVQQRCTPDDEEKLDSLMQLMQDITSYLDGRELEQLPDARWLGAEGQPMYDPGQLDTERVFTGAITHAYRLIVPRGQA